MPSALIFAIYPLWCFSEDRFIQIYFRSIGTSWLHETNIVYGLMVTKFSHFQPLCVPCRAKQDVVCYYGNRGSPEPIHLKAGLCFFYYGCCRNLSVCIFLSSQPLALRVSLTFLFWRARWLSVYWSIEPEGHKPSLLVSFFNSCQQESMGWVIHCWILHGRSCCKASVTSPAWWMTRPCRAMDWSRSCSVYWTTKTCEFTWHWNIACVSEASKTNSISLQS